MENLSVHLDEKGRKVIATFKPAGAVSTVTAEELARAVVAAGFGEYGLLQPAIDLATEKHNSGEAFEIEVAEAMDGSFALSIAPDMLAVYLSCSPARGGTRVERQSVLDEAMKRGISATLDLDAIDRALHEGGDKVLIASGKAPVPGVDGKFELLFPRIKERTPHLDAQGMADFRDLGDIVTVNPGDRLMRIVAPTEGEPGVTVTGKLIPVRAGKKVSFPGKLEGVAIDAADPNVLVSVITGAPAALKDAVKVDPVFTIQDVDLHSGNISFDGTIHVMHDVHVDMSIKASGDIFVDGTVENASLTAGGDIVVRGGIIGASELHAHSSQKSHPQDIFCEGSCTAHFVQNAHISAGNGIFIHDSAMLSELVAGQQIVVGDENSRKGEIIGGIVRATMLIKAKNIGAPSGLRTIVIAGADQQLHERLNASVKEREAAEHKLADIIRLLGLVRLHPDRLPAETVMTAKAMRDALNVEIETLHDQEAELNREIALADGAQVIAEKHVFGGVEIRIGVEHYSTNEPREGGVFHITEEGLVFD